MRTWRHLVTWQNSWPYCARVCPACWEVGLRFRFVSNKRIHTRWKQMSVLDSWVQWKQSKQTNGGLRNFQALYSTDLYCSNTKFLQGTLQILDCIIWDNSCNPVHYAEQKTDDLTEYSAEINNYSTIYRLEQFSQSVDLSIGLSHLNETIHSKYIENTQQQRLGSSQGRSVVEWSNETRKMPRTYEVYSRPCRISCKRNAKPANYSDLTRHLAIKDSRYAYKIAR